MFTIHTYTMLEPFIVDVSFYQVKMLMFYNA